MEKTQLEFFNRRIESLVEDSRRNDLVDDDIKQQANELIKIFKTNNKQANKNVYYYSTMKLFIKYLLIAFLIFIFFQVLFSIEDVQRFFYWAIKLSFAYTIQNLNNRISEAIYFSNCLIQNPFYLKNVLSEDDCELCENLKLIPRISNISSKLFVENFLKRDRPIIITDSINSSWLALTLFSTSFLNTIFQKEDELHSVAPCSFTSNVRMNQGSIPKFLKLASEGHITNWYANWENCQPKASKKIRSFFSQPYFMPLYVQPSLSNWIFLSSEYTTNKFKAININEPLIWIGQLKGENKFKLTPRFPCNETCTPLYVTLHAKEMLVFTDILWKGQYVPVSSKEVIAVGFGGFLD